MSSSTLPDTTALIQEGNDFLNAGNYATAIEKYKQVLDIEPQNAKALFNTGLAHYIQRQYAEALSFFQQVVAIDSGDYEAFYYIGICYEFTNNYDEALENYRKATNIKPNYTAAAKNAAILLENKGLFDDAINVLQEYIKIDDANADVYNEWGICLYQKKQYEDALQKFTKAIEINPQYYQALNNIGLCHYYLGRNKEAIETFEKVITIEPRYEKAYNNLGMTLAANGDFDEAINKYEKAIEINPDYDLAKQNLAYAKDQKKITVDPIEEDRLKEKQKARETANTFNEVGNKLYSEKAYKEAMVEYEKAILADPTFPYAVHNTGLCYMYLEEYEKAIEFFDKTLAIKSDYLPSLKNKAWSLESIGKLQEAMDIHNSIAYSLTDIDAKDKAEACNDCGLILVKRNKTEEAIKKFNDAIGFKNDYADAVHNLGYTYHINKNYAEAIAKYKEAIAMDENNVNIALYYSNLGIAYSDSGNSEEAVKAYKASINKNNDQQNTFYNLAGELANLNFYDEAIGYLDIAIQKNKNYEYALHNKSSYLKLQGNFVEAKKAANVAVKAYAHNINNNNLPATEKEKADYYFYYGNIMLDANESLEDIKHVLKKGLAINENHPNIMSALSKLYLHMSANSKY